MEAVWGNIGGWLNEPSRGCIGFVDCGFAMNAVQKFMKPFFHSAVVSFVRGLSDFILLGSLKVSLPYQDVG